MFSLNDKISLRQLQTLLLLDIFGTGVIILPRKAAVYAGRDGWISVLLSGLMAVACAVVITKLASKFRNKDFFEYASVIVSKPVAFLLSLGLLCKIVLTIACELRFFGEISKHILLYNTPLWVIVLCLLGVSAFAAGKGYETRARIGQIIIWLVFIPIIFVFSIAATDVDFTEVLPVLESPPRSVLKGGFYCLFAFSGLEFLLLCAPYLKNTKRMTKSSVSAVVAMGILMSVITLITICRFGPANITSHIWPVLDMMDTIDIPGSFIERQEALVMSFWILSVFAIVNAGLFFASILTKSVIKKGSHWHYMVLTCFVVLIITMLLKDINSVYALMDSLYLYLGTAYMFFIPAALLVIAKIRRL